MAGGADVNLGIDIEKKGQGDKEAAAGLELVAKAADDATDELKQLDRKLLETRAAMLAAGKGFADGTNQFKEFGKAAKDVRQVETVIKALKRAGQDAGEPAAVSFLQRFGNTVSAGLPEIGGLSSGMSSALVYGAVAAAPAIGAAINAAVLLGLGGGTIAGGILLASKDPRVRDAWAEVGKTAKAGLTDAADVFVAPLERSAALFQKTLSGTVIPSLRKDFASLAPSVDRLSAGMAAFVNNAMPGLNKAILASVPVIDAAGDGMARLGSAVGFAGSQFALGSGGAKDMTQDLITLADATIRTTGTTVGLLSKAYELSHIPGFGGLIQTISAVDEHSKNASKSFQLLGDQQAIAATQAHALAVNEQQAADALKRLNDLTAIALGTSTSLAQDNNNVATAFATVRDAIDHGTHSLDINSEAGRNNRDKILGAADALRRQRDDAIAAAGGVNASKDAQDAANKKYDDGIGQLRGLADKMDTAGAKADDLAAALRSIPDIQRTVAIDYITTHINRYVSDQGGASAYQQSANVLYRAMGGVVGAARGLIASAPAVVFGERTLPEAYIPARNSGISQGRADMLLGTAASWWGRRMVPAGRGGGGPVFNITVNAGMGANGNEIAKVIAKQIRTNPAFAGLIAGAST